MARNHIDHILQKWDYDPEDVCVRTVKGKDGRQVLQMRIDLGVLQIEMEGRPDGAKPHGFQTYYDYLLSESLTEGDDFTLDDEQCSQADREFVQFYHRRICWLSMRKYDSAVQDASHTLALMDFCRRHSPDEDWTMTHEQYRPFVLFHRTQAAALSQLEADDEGTDESAELAIHAINEGLGDFRAFFASFEMEERYDDDELVSRLVELRESLRQKFEVGRTIYERLADAVASEHYELAARLRDELRQRQQR